MEIKKTSVSTIAIPEIPQKSEVSKTKSSAENLISDSFETSKSSDTNQGSSASSEPEKKAGQITGGILIRQMTAARIGQTNAKQSGDISGKKDLSPEQQTRVSNSDPQKDNLKPSNSLQDARSRYEGSKNSGLQVPFAPAKGDASSRIPNVSKDQIVATLGQSASEQTSNAVKDADRLVDGGSLRSQVDAEVAERHQDSNALGGSRTDRLSDLLNPTSAGPQQSGQTHGKDQIAYEQVHTNLDYKDGSLTTYIDSEGSTKDGHASIIHQKNTRNLDGTSKITTTETSYPDDHTKVEQHTSTSFDANNNETKSEMTKVTTKNDGTITVFTGNTSTSEDGSTTTTTEETTVKDFQLISSVTKETKTNKDGSSTTKVTNETNTPAGGGAKSYDPENYTGNIPESVKKVMDYFKQQAISQKPSSGGETVHTDDNAAADPTIGGRASNLVVQQGNLGLLGNPGSATTQTGGGQGYVGSSQSGGNVDFGPDSDQVGYNGPTHQDDPGDVQFGSQSPVVKDAVESKNSNDDSKDSNDLTDILNRKRRQSAAN
jgi:hypothetical protein